MKLSALKKHSIWDRFGRHEGRYKNFNISIIEGSNGLGRIREYYWVSFESEKYKKGHNSIWENRKFSTIDEAKDYAIKWVNDFTKEQKAGRTK